MASLVNALGAQEDTRKGNRQRGDDMGCRKLDLTTVMGRAVGFAVLLFVACGPHVGICYAAASSPAGQPPSRKQAPLLKQFGKTPMSGDLKDAMVDLQYEAAYCSSLYSLMYAGAEQAGVTGKSATKLLATADQARKLTFALGQKTGMSEAAMKAQAKIDAQALVRNMGGTWANLPVVMDKDGPKCRQLITSPRSRLSYWLAVERKSRIRAKKR